MWERMKQKISDWYYGDFETYESPVVIGGFIRRHWTSRMLHFLIDFHVKEWKWALPFYIAVAGLGLGIAGEINLR